MTSNFYVVYKREFDITKPWHYLTRVPMQGVQLKPFSNDVCKYESRTEARQAALAYMDEKHVATTTYGEAASLEVKLPEVEDASSAAWGSDSWLAQRIRARAGVASNQVAETKIMMQLDLLESIKGVLQQHEETIKRAK